LHGRFVLLFGRRVGPEQQEGVDKAFVTYTAPDKLGQAMITATSGDLFETMQVQVGHCSHVYLPLIVRSY
jgi:hypothetical protein